MEKSIKEKKFSRRRFFRISSLAIAALAGAKFFKTVSAAEASLKDKKLAMVIDLQRCTGCGGCIISCKNENNQQEGFAWSNKINRTVGKFPNVRYEYIPTLCNNCENAPCVAACPTRAMHKGYADITMHNPDKCIGCRSCIAACPYGVIYFNDKKPHRFWGSDKPLIKNGTSSAREVVEKVKGRSLPYYNPDREKSTTASGIRSKGIVEKCTFCDHRVNNGELPYCVLRCPAKARIFGDINDPNSEVTRLVTKYRPFRLKEHLGTEPKVFYVREFNAGTYEKTAGSV